MRMMRHWNVKQERIYQAYKQLGKQLKKTDYKNLNWELITREGIWKLPIPKKYSGAGFSWDDCVFAVKGLVNTCRDEKFFSSLISQFSVLYLLLQYGTETQKIICIPKLVLGETATVNIIDNNVSSYHELNITISKDLNLSFLIPKNSSMFNDFINFKKLFYGILAAEFAFYVVDDCKEILNKSSPTDFGESIKNKYKETEKNIHHSRQKFYLLFSNLVDEKKDKQFHMM
jgi:hypothetical protein